jgi:hypothetical protein
VQSTNHRLVLIDMNLVRDVLIIAISFDGGVFKRILPVD